MCWMEKFILIFLIQKSISQTLPSIPPNSIYIFPKYFQSTLPSKIPLAAPILQIPSDHSKISTNPTPYTHFPLQLENLTLTDFIPQPSQYQYYPTPYPNHGHPHNRHPYSEQIRQSNYYVPPHLQSPYSKPLIYYKAIPPPSPIQYKTLHPSYTPIYPTSSNPNKNLPTKKPYKTPPQINNLSNQFYNPFNPLTVPPVYVKNPPIPVPQYQHQHHHPPTKDHEESRDDDDSEEEDEELNEEEEEENEEVEAPERYSRTRGNSRGKTPETDFEPYYRYRDEEDEGEELNEDEDDEDEAESKLKNEIVHLIEKSDPKLSQVHYSPIAPQRQIQFLQQKWLVKTSR